MPVEMSRRQILAGVGALAIGVAARAEDTVPDVGGQWDEAAGLIAEKVGGIGYHTTLPTGMRVHPTRSNLDYALRLLNASASEATVQRASRVIATILGYQDTDPASANYGIWPWYVEESLAQMAPPDPNWANFNGARISELLLDYPAVLAPDLQEKMRRSLECACASIIRRDVGPGYTNIAMMAARVTLAGGQILQRREFSDYGRDHLRLMLDYTREQGGFNEYNSPTYTMVALEELEAILGTVRDPIAQADAETLFRMTWQSIAEHWHPASSEWAGPHSRGYTDRLGKDIRAKLAARTGLPLTLDSVPPLAGRAMRCPADLVGRFQRLPQSEIFEHIRFIRKADDDKSTYGSTWLSAGACLGSANREGLWTQHHPVIGYWPGKGQANVFRVRTLKDGKDFASMGVTAVQKGARILLGVHPIAGAGDWHVTLDRPKDGVFQGQELRIRFSLDGEGAAIEQAAPDHYRLAADGWKIVIRLSGPAADWQMVRQEGLVALDYVRKLGGAFTIESLHDLLVPACIALLPAQAVEPSAPMKRERVTPGFDRLRWGDDMDVVVPHTQYL